MYLMIKKELEGKVKINIHKSNWKQEIVATIIFIFLKDTLVTTTLLESMPSYPVSCKLQSDKGQLRTGTHTRKPAMV